MKQRKLTDLSLDELWQLFPVILTAHQDHWANWYKEEAEFLKEKLPYATRLSHIGSTAVREIRAKLVIDILAEVPGGKPLAGLKDTIEKCGYMCMAESCNRIDFNKGYTMHGLAARVFHLHLRRSGDHDELYFRDYLRADAAIAKEYEQLKLDLWKQYEHDRDAYTFCKGEFIKHYTEKGKQLFAGRYDNEADL